MKTEKPGQHQVVAARIIGWRVLILVPLALWMSMLSSDLRGQEFSYVTNNDSITITGYTGPGGAVVVPAILVGLPVTSIENYAFNDDRVVTSVNIPESVTYIGQYAFHYCISLTAIIVDGANPVFSSLDGVLLNKNQSELIRFPNGKVGDYTVPDSVAYIGGLAFYSCTGLTRVTIANGVTNIGYEAFSYCANLTGVTIPNSVTCIGSAAFDHCTSLTDTTIPDSVTYIGGWAFAGCTNLNHVTVPNSVTNIGASAFDWCTGLTSVEIGNGVTVIGKEAFAHCSNLSAIGVDAGNPAFSSVDGVLFDRAQTSLFQCPGGKAGSYSILDTVTNISSLAFSYCGGLTSVSIPNGVTSIADSTFFACTNLSEVAIPDSVLSIGDTAFARCTSLTNVNVGKNIAKIGEFAFGLCRSLAAITVDPSNLTYSSVNGVLLSKDQTTLLLCPQGKVGSYTIPETVTAIGFAAFSGCAGLTNIAIPNSVTSMRSLAFYYCTSLNGVTIPDSVTNVAAQAFYNCTNLTSITLGNGVVSIGDSAFLYCTGLTNVEIPNNVISIGSAAFSECSNLTSVAIGSGVSEIVPNAFRQCPGLTALEVEAGNLSYSSLDGVLFDKTQTTLIRYPEGKAGNYSVPDSVTSIGGYAFTGSTSLTNVTVPNSVTNIGDESFYYCTSVTGVMIGNGVTRIGEYAFTSCRHLQTVHFLGDAPSTDAGAFLNTEATVYYLPGTTGWGATFGDRPTAPWVLPNPVMLNSGPSFGLQTNTFGFIISWATNVPVVVDACTDLANPSWSPLSTNTLTEGWSYFGDQQWTNYPTRFYRLRSQ